MRVEPIGIIHTPFKRKKDKSTQRYGSRVVGTIEVFKKYREGLCDIDGFSHIVLIFKFHRSRGYRLKVKPFLDHKQRGLFATRAPRRPNQLGMSIVKLRKRRGNILKVEGVDMLDGTPLLDIKPYIPNSNPKRGIRIGWLEGKKK
jgi:tRNA-Thr(GGU) m(6)t(6)A37 methyltransferase TsaA